jgi:hypothetical protein
MELRQNPKIIRNLFMFIALALVLMLPAVSAVNSISANLTSPTDNSTVSNDAVNLTVNLSYAYVPGLTNFTDRNLSLKISRDSVNELICPQCLDNDGTWLDLVTDSFCTAQSINFSNFSFNDFALTCPRTDGLFVLRIRMGLPGTTAVTKFYGLVNTSFLPNLTLNNYLCKNHTSGQLNITNCDYAVDDNLDTYAGIQDGGQGYITFIYLNYTYNDYITSSKVYVYNSTDNLVNNTTYTFTNGTTNSFLGIVVNLIDGAYKWFYEVTDTKGETNITSNWTFNVLLSSPQINYTTPTEVNDSNKSQSWIYINITVNESNEANITFRLYNNAFTLINNTTYIDNRTYENFTGLDDGIYYYNVTVTNILNYQNTTETRKIILDKSTPWIILNNLINTSIPLFKFINVNFTYNVSDLNGPCSALGGAITIDGDYCVHTFIDNGTFDATSNLNASILVVAGGGGGTSISGGGGGGVVYNSSFPLISDTQYNVVVGSGGIGTKDALSQNGGNSSFGNVMIGVGGGAGSWSTNGFDGGSGGGGSPYTYVGGNSTQGNYSGIGYGNKGGDFGTTGYLLTTGAGGGGAGGVGHNTTTDGGVGGEALTFNISGINVDYGGGGGGGGTNAAGGTNNSSGGKGGDIGNNYPATNGVAYTGGGGGGGGIGTDYWLSGNGSSGIVIVRYPKTNITNGSGIKNTTLYIYNATNGNSLINQTTQSYNLLDIFNNTVIGIPLFLTTGAYNWFADVFDFADNYNYTANQTLNISIDPREPWNSSSTNTNEWKMYGRDLNNSNWDGTTYSTISGFNKANYSVGADVTKITVAKGYVYASSVNGNLYQFNASNVSQLLNTFVSGAASIYTLPIVAGDYVYIGDYNSPYKLHQLNATNISQEIAFYTTSGTCQWGGVVYNGSYFKTCGSTLYQLNASNISKYINNFTGVQDLFSVAIAGNNVYVNGWLQGLYQLNLSNISQVISSISIGGGWWSYSAPSVYKDYVYIGTVDPWNRIYQLDATNVSQIIINAPAPGQGVYALPVFKDDFIYYITVTGGVLYQANISNISQVYQSASITGNAYDLVRQGDSIFTSGNGVLFQINASNISQTLHQVSITSGNPIGVSDKYLYQGSGGVDDKLYMFNVDDITLENSNGLIAINITYPLSINYSTAITQLNFTVDGFPTTCYYNINGTNVSTNCSQNISGLTANQGYNTWLIYMTDGTVVNNSSVTFYVDNIIPSINLTNLSSIINQSNIIFEYNVSDKNGSDGNGSGIKNTTFYLYNNTSGSLINSTTNSSLINIFSSVISIPLILTDGIYNWFADVYDNLNNYNNTVNQTFTVNTIYPNEGINSTGMQSNTSNVSSNSVYVNITVEGNYSNITYRLYNITNNSLVNETITNETSLNFSNLGDGHYTYYWIVTGENYLQNISNNYTLTLDTQAPRLSQDYPPNLTTIFYVNSSNVTFNFTANDSTSGLYNITFYVYTRPANTSVYNLTLNYSELGLNNNALTKYLTLSDGNYYWKLDAYDFANNYIDPEGNFTVDTSVPEINYTEPTAANYSNVSRDWIYINVSVNESNLGNVSFGLFYSNFTLVNNTTYASTTYENFTGLPNGKYLYQVIVNDTAGNQNNTELRSITLDTANPSINASTISNTNQTNINFTWTINDTISGVKNTTIYVYNGTGTLVNNTTKTSSDLSDIFNAIIGIPMTLSEGIYTWFANVFDFAGNYNATTNQTFQIITTVPTIEFDNNTFANSSNVSQSSVYAAVNTTSANISSIIYNLYYQNLSLYNSTVISGGGTLSEGLKGYWPFDETGGNIAYDSLGLNNIPVAHSDNFTLGKLGNSYTPYVENVSNFFDWTNETQITINLWMNQSQAVSVAEGRIFNTYTSISNGDFYLRTEDAGGVIDVFIHDASTAHQFNAYSPIINQWVMYTLVVNSSNITTYIDGVYNYSEALDNFVWNDKISLFCRRDGQVSSCMRDELKLDEMSVWNRTLSNNEVLDLYNGGNGMTYTELISPSLYYNWTNISDGHYWYQVIVNDTVGNQNNTELRSITLDTHLPTINQTYPKNLSYINTTNITFTYEVKDNYTNSTASLPDSGIYNSTFYLYNVANLLINNTTLTYSTLNLYTNSLSTQVLLPGDGNYTWFVDSHDFANNYQDPNETFIIDTANPEINYTSPTEVDDSNISQTWIYVNVSVIDANYANTTFRLYYDNNTLINQTILTVDYINWTALINDKYKYNVTVLDLANNQNSTETRQITLDTISPQINVTSPLNNSYINTTLVNFTWDINDTLSGIKNTTVYVYNNSGNLINNTTITSDNLTNIFTAIIGIPIILADGIYSWFIDAWDFAGNYNSSNQTYESPVGGCSAIGGTITEDGDYCVHTFITNGTFDTISNLNASILVVGGGGGGASMGGGGGGGIVYNSSFSLISNTQYDVIVGVGGIGTEDAPPGGGNGSNSSFGDIMIGVGGGGGGQGTNGSNGGSGGGGSPSVPAGLYVGGYSIQENYSGIGYGNRGGSGGTTGYCGTTGPGGGGAGSVGYNITDIGAGAGGDALIFNISGSDVGYGGGGGGGSTNASGGTNGSSGGKGGDQIYSFPATNGIANTGGGGGGGGVCSFWRLGGNGSSGIVIVRYLKSEKLPGFMIDTVYPEINYTSPTEANDSNVSQNWVYANVSINESNEANITFRLYNSAFTLINNTTYTDNRTYQNFTNLSDEVYYYNVTIVDLMNNPNSTETRKITLDTLAPSINQTSPANLNYSTSGTINFTWNVSDINGSFNGTGIKNTSVYVYSGSEKPVCYQESANTSNQTGIDGNCNLNYTGNYYFDVYGVWGGPVSNFVDGNWSSLFNIDPDGSSYSYLYFNYTKPPQAISSIWKVAIGSSDNDSGTHINFSINDSNCFNSYTDKVELKLYPFSGWIAGSGPAKFNASCYNGTDWINLGSASPVVPYYGYLYEEGMYWNVSQFIFVNNTTKTSTDLGDIFNAIIGIPILLSDGIYNWFVDAWDFADNRNYTSNRTLTVDSGFPSYIYFTPPTKSNGTYENNDWIAINVSADTSNISNITYYLYNGYSNGFNCLQGNGAACGVIAPSHPYGGLNYSSYYYTKPSGARQNDTLWHVKHGYDGPWPGSCGAPTWPTFDPACVGNYNITIPQDCWDYSSVLNLRIYGGVSIWTGYQADSYPMCYNGTNWKEIGTHFTGFGSNPSSSLSPLYSWDGDFSTWMFYADLIGPGSFLGYGDTDIQFATARIYDSDMYWNIDYSSTNASVNFTGLLDGIYYYNATAFRLNGLTNSTETREITLDTLYPQINYSTGTLPNDSRINYSWIYINTSVTEANEKNITFYLYNSSGLHNNTTYTNGTHDINFTNLSDGNYNYSVTIYDQTNKTNSTSVRTISIDTIAPIITVTSPSPVVNYAYINGSIDLNLTISDLNPGNCTLWYNGTNTTIPCNTTHFSLNLNGTHVNQTNNNLIIYANDTYGGTTVQNVTWYYKILENSRTYNATTFETASEKFIINLNGTGNASITAYLNYDGTEYGATKTGDDRLMNFTYTKLIPSGTGNKTFYWKVYYTNGSSETIYTNTSNITVNQTLFGLCNSSINSTLTTKFWNMTFKDEVNGSYISSAIDSLTGWYWLSDRSVNKTIFYSNSTVNSEYDFCGVPNRTIYGDISFLYSNTAAAYSQRQYTNHSMSFNNSTSNMTFYLLNTADGKWVQIQTADVNGNAMSGVTIVVTRTISGVSTVVASGVTDTAGSLTLFLTSAFPHTFALSKDSCTSQTVVITPTLSSYTLTMACASNIPSSPSYSSLEGIRYYRGPMLGVTTPKDNQLFDYFVDSAYRNITRAYFRLSYSNGSTIATNESFIGSNYCNATSCYLSLYFNTSKGNDLKGAYYVDLGNGYILLESDARWRFIQTNISNNSVKSFGNTLKNFLANWHVMNETGQSCEQYFNSSACTMNGCYWATDVNGCYDFNYVNRIEYSRIVLVFLVFAIVLAVFGRITGYDAQNPGIFLFMLTFIVGLGTFSNGLSGQGYFYYSNLTPWSLINNTILFVTMMMISIGLWCSQIRRHT